MRLIKDIYIWPYLIHFSQVAVALHGMGIQPHGDMEMINMVKNSVQKLCRKELILASLLEEESREGEMMAAADIKNVS